MNNRYHYNKNQVGKKRRKKFSKKYKKTPENIHDLAFIERDEEITKLEFQRSYVEEDLEEAIAEFIKITKLRRFKRRRKRLTPLLKDGKNPDKVKVR